MCISEWNGGKDRVNQCLPPVALVFKNAKETPGKNGELISWGADLRESPESLSDDLEGKSGQTAGQVK